MKVNKLVTYRCSECSTIVDVEDKYCRMCGNPFFDAQDNEAFNKESEKPVSEGTSCVSTLSPLIDKK